MKVALSFSGLPRGNYQRNIDQHVEAFGGDLFLSTWKGHEFRGDMTTWPEPESDYLKPHTEHLNEYKRMIRGRGYKQILAHSLQCLFSIPKDYDVIIRCRYDVTVNPNVDWQSFICDCYENDTVIGIRRHYENYQWDKPEEKKPKGLLCDQLIIHRSDAWDPSVAMSLFHSESLNPCEEGWYQVFHNNPQKNYVGGCKLDK